MKSGETRRLWAGALSMVDFGVRWAFLPVKTQSDKNVQPTFKDLTMHQGTRIPIDQPNLLSPCRVYD